MTYVADGIVPVDAGYGLPGVGTMKRFNRFLGAWVGILVIAAIGGCPEPNPNPNPNKPPSPLPDRIFAKANRYPYVVHNGTVQTFISANNQSLQWGLELRVTFRDMNGAQVSSFQKRLNAGACHRFSPPMSFEGSVLVEGRGAQLSLVSQIEVRRVDGKGAALATPAFGPWGHNCVWWVSVVDSPSSSLHTRLNTYNWHDNIPLYVKFFHLMDEGCQDIFEVAIDPQAVYSCFPTQVFQHGAANGVEDFEVICYGNRGPNSSGIQDGGYIQSLYATGADGLAMESFVSFWPEYWVPIGADYWPHLYVPDVQDDGVNRADRVYVKFGLVESNIYSYFTVHLYDENGGDTTTKLFLMRNADSPNSRGIIEPMNVVGKPFKGSVWVDTQGEPMRTHILRTAPGKWVDYSRGWPVREGNDCVIPYVSSKDDAWEYELVLFYPEAVYPRPSDPLADPPPPITYGGPSVVPPPADERVVLRFFDMAGNYRGWVAVCFLKNETKRLTLTQVASYLGAFEGSVQIEPLVAMELEMKHINGEAHGSLTPGWTYQYSIFF